MEQKEYKKVSIEGLPLIGAGANGAVYRLNQEQIIKVYNPLTNPMGKILQEKKTAKEAFTHGIPTAISFDMVQVDEKYGIIYEMIDAKTLGTTMSENPEQLDALAVRMAQLLKKLHSTEFEPGVLPDARDSLMIWVKVAEQSGVYDDDLIDKMRDVVRGQSIAAGTKIGQINSVGTYKVEAQIDEHYIDRVIAGLEATFERQGETYSTVIRKVYPEVRDGKFKADFKFDGEQPDNIRAGQTYYLNLQLGQPEEAVIIPRGTFYQKTGGKWIYVVNKEGTKAVKREIHIDRQNPQYYEVLEGLEPGERVITSGYDTYGDSDVLVF